jgi:chromate reductase
MPTVARILAFSGSARKDSLNKKLLANVVSAVRAAGGDVTLVDLTDFALPLFNGDLEDAEGLPANAQKLIALINDHAGLLIASPEYNSMFTPLLKNTIDWCTRGDDNPFIEKVAAVVSASPGALGGVRSMILVRALLTHLGCHVIPAQCILPQADKAFDASGKLTVARVQDAANKVGASLVETVRKLHPSIS